MKRLRASHDGFTLYHAGLPAFPRNFARDAIYSALLLGDAAMLREQLAFCSARQGKARDPLTGEEPGKVFHEYPPFMFRGACTLYNACDTTALFLLGHRAYRGWTGDAALAASGRASLRDAAGYILAHLQDGLFAEAPACSGARRLALKVTYWKDSAIHGREGGEPAWPAVFPLAHLQNLQGLRAAAELLEDPALAEAAARMARAIPRLIDPRTGAFFLARDAKGPIRSRSSDLLHALAFLEPGDLPKRDLDRLVASAACLETPAGWRALSPGAGARMKDGYQTRTVWPFEQAVIHAGARRHGYPGIAAIAERVLPWLDTDPELLVLEDGGIAKGGCDPQLWTLAAKAYFRAPHAFP